MRRKIVGVTVGTSLSPEKIKEKINPVLSVNGEKPNAAGDVECKFTFEGLTEDQKAALKGDAGEDGGYYTPNMLSDGTLMFIPSKSNMLPVGSVGNVKGRDGEDGERGSDGRGIASIARTSGNGAAGTTDTYTITYTDNTKTTFTVYNGSNGSNGSDGKDGKDGVSATHSWNGTTLTITSASGSSSANLKGDKGDKGDSIKGDTGAVGERGYGILNVTGGFASYTTAVNGLTPAYRILLSRVFTDSQVSKVLVGDAIRYSYYIYPVIYVDDTYAYTSARSNIRGAAGAAGAAGADGASVTVSSVNESTADGGNNVVTFSDGKTLTVKNGSKGSKGDKGDDYVITSTDKQEIKNDILSSIITQEAGESESLVMSQKAVTDLVAEAIGSGGGGGGGSTEYETVDSVDEMTDTSKSYVLSTDGYIYTYTEKTETVYHEAENKFVASEAQINKRMGSSSLSAQDGYVWSNAIPVDLTKETPFRVKIEGTKILEDTTGSSGGYQKLWLCSDTTGNTKLNASVIQLGQTSSNYTTLVKDGSAGVLHADYKGGAKVSDSIISQTKSIRVGFWFSSSAIGSTSELSGVKITIPCEAYSEEVTTSAWVSTGMKPSASGGGGNYVELLVKVNKNTTDIAEVSKRVTNLETGSESVTIPTFWQSAVDACIAKIKALQVGRNCITFPFFSDNHQRNGYAGMLIAHVMKECNIPYCFYGGDSISNDVVADEATMIEQDKAFDAIMSYVPNGRLCRAVGNHDGYWYDGTNKYWYNREQVYELFLREESIAQNKHFGDNGTYYYVDDIAGKVRFIVLNTNVHRDASGNIVGNNVEAEQLSWLQNTALSFSDSGWAVVFISHQPISNHYHANISNAEAVRTVVTNYINGTATNKADIVGWFSGHIHRDRIYTGVAKNTTDDSVGTAMPFKQVTITSDHTGIAYDDATKHTVANDDQSHAIDFVTINKATRTVNITRLGIGADRSYTY